jgi:transcriptional regulator of acetoin/glycerol metabolism
VASQPLAPLTYQQATRQFQKEFVADTLRELDWNIAETAKRLDVARSYLYSLIKIHGIERQ